jgi:hypothetical protein
VRNQVIRLLFASVALLAAGQSLPAQQPALAWERPQGFSGGGGDRRYSFVSSQVDAVLDIYPFRPLPPNLTGQFRQSLFRDLIVTELREQRYGSAPGFDLVSVPGADSAVLAGFVEDYWGTARNHLRLAVFRGGSVALVDYNASNPDAYQRNLASLQGVLRSLSVTARAATAAAVMPGRPIPGGADLRGLYTASVQYFYPSMSGSVGSGSWQLRTQFYLLAADGRLYRGYDVPNAPNGDIARFDFDDARLRDPQNSGTYSVSGTRVLIRMGDPNVPDEITATRIGADQLEINQVRFQRQLRQ